MHQFVKVNIYSPFSTKRDIRALQSPTLLLQYLQETDGFFHSVELSIHRTMQFIRVLKKEIRAWFPGRTTEHCGEDPCSCFMQTMAGKSLPVFADRDLPH